MKTFCWVLCLEYEGSTFHGWQTQPQGKRTLQASLEQALSQVANEPISTICAGRTDSGVHACQQFVHIHTKADRQEVAWVLGTNTYLPPQIRVLWAQKVDPFFDARRSATWRRYRYIVLQQRTAPAHLKHLVTWLHHALDIEPMQKAASALLGEHDFSSFRAIDCQAKSPIRSIHRFDIYPQRRFLVFDVVANAFLQHMVRNLVGTLFLVGFLKKPPEWVKQVLAAKDRTQAGPTAPSSGLYLVDVHYPRYSPLFPKGPLGPDLVV